MKDRQTTEKASNSSVCRSRRTKTIVLAGRITLLPWSNYQMYLPIKQGHVLLQHI